jgi:hypothetical protein
MRRRSALLTAMTFALAGLVVWAVTAASAQSNSLTLSISPPVFELSANPGERIQNSIRVTNLSDDDHRIFVDKRNFTALGEEGGVNLTEDDTSYSLAKWIEVDKSGVIIPAKKSEVFEFTITVPANAEPGGHFGSLVFKTEPGELRDGQAGAAVGQEVGALLLVKVAGDVNEQLGVASFQALKRLYERGPVTFETRTENTGNVHLKPRGTITITNTFGREVASVQIDERNVLPDAIRKVDTVWDDSSLRFGRYTATLSLVYGAEGTIVNASTSVFMFPTKLAAGVLAVLAAVGYVGYRYKDRFREAYKALTGKR